MPDGELRTPVSKVRTIEIARGGRLGYTLRWSSNFESSWDHFSMVVIGVAVAGMGIIEPGLIGTVIVAIGGFIAGAGIERMRAYSRGTVVESSDER